MSNNGPGRGVVAMHGDTATLASIPQPSVHHSIPSPAKHARFIPCPSPAHPMVPLRSSRRRCRAATSSCRPPRWSSWLSRQGAMLGVQRGRFCAAGFAVQRLPCAGMLLSGMGSGTPAGLPTKPFDSGRALAPGHLAPPASLVHAQGRHPSFSVFPSQRLLSAAGLAAQRHDRLVRVGGSHGRLAPGERLIPSLVRVSNSH